ncbi:phosphoribosylglycinamide formyltransferase [Vibrio sp. SM6]|uniref:Phosphoribosylglycinamide formyltransferase n=1 Tax=Vibrio agarilyticus TaxID=2726741 RepID=A0A7X8TR17_9VIBR|nr:phosphoribosylglycinamide formyltransferase [Vibrio agarilyticus]NLS13184.1 phosphoribosylglycinamide formyltransferase [Vibrio agarilyticus]
MKNIVVLISGSGSNLQAIIDACHSPSLSKICAVFSNKANAYGLTRAKEAAIPAHFIDPKAYETRENFDQALMHAIDEYQPDIVVLAGYMRILSPEFVQRYAGRLVNIHPSLLPRYPGIHTHQRALEAGDREHGATVHFVTEELDGGPVILQARVPIFDGDDEAALIARVQHQEHFIYPLVVKWLVSDRLSMQDNRAYLDGQCLGPQGYAADELDL